MIRIYVGLPRSGKTYKVVSDIVKDYIGEEYIRGQNKTVYSFFKRPSKEIKYRYLYTNIQGFKFDDINDYFSNRDINRWCYKLDWKKFYHHISKMYEMALKDAPDEDLIEYAKKYSMYQVLFVDDEAYMHFTDSTRDPVLVWFLGYHGHLGFDIWMITQNKKKINSKYYMDCESFIEAQPKSKSISDNHLRYFYYASDSFTKDQRYLVQTVKTEQAIYDLYISGDIYKPKKIVYRYFAILAFLAVATVGIFYFFLSHFAGNDQLSQNDNTEISRDHPGRNYSDSDLELFQINCDDKQCWNGSEKYRNFSYPVDLAYSVLDRNGFDVIKKSNVASLKHIYKTHDTKDGYRIDKYYVYVHIEQLKRDLPDFFILYQDNPSRSIVKNFKDTNGIDDATI